MKNYIYRALSVLAATVCSFVSVYANSLKVAEMEVLAMWQDEYNFVWMGTHEGLYRYEGGSYTRFVSSEQKSGSIYNNNIRSICGDGRGSLYVISKFALSRYDASSERFTTICESGIRAIAFSGSEMLVASNNSIMAVRDDSLRVLFNIPKGYGKVTTMIADQEVICLGTDRGLLIFEYDGFSTCMYKDESVVSLFKDSRGMIWVGTRFSGVFAFSSDGNQLHLGTEDREVALPSGYIYSISENNSGKICIATIRGLCLYDTFTRELQQKSDSPALCVMKDREGRIWRSSPDGVYVDDDFGGVKTYDQVFSGGRASLIDAMIEDKTRGVIYIATEESGVISMDVASGRCVPFPYNTSLSSFNTRDFYLDDDSRSLWVGTRLGGLDKVDLETGTVTTFSATPDPFSLPHDNSFCIYPYGDSLVVATGLGVVKMDKKSGRCVPVTTSPLVWNNTPIDVLLDSRKRCWISVSGGLLCRNLDSSEEKSYFFDDHSLVGTNNICCLFEDSFGTIWMGTTGSGILRYDQNSDGFTRLSKEDGTLAGDYIYSIVQTRQGTLLACTDGGVCRIGSDYGFFPIDSFVKDGMYVMDDGTIIVCGFRKMASFTEDFIPSPKAPEKVLFMALEVDGKPIEVGGDDGILAESILTGGAVNIPPGHSSFSVQSYCPGSSQGSEFSYRLYPNMKQWGRAKSGQRLNFGGLRAGKYTLETDCSDPVSVRIYPYWYLSTPAVVIYILAVILLIVVFMREFESKRRLSDTLEQERKEKRMLAYISHEIRTPVTLIQSYVDSLMRADSISSASYARVVAIQRNLSKVNSLLRDIIDMKSDVSGSFNVVFNEQNMGAYLEKLTASFQDYALVRNISLSFDNRAGDLVLWYDSEQIDKVMYNLISNAFKNTQEGGRINVMLERAGDYASVSVGNNGEAIAPEYINKIFQPFFQIPGSSTINQGTGLGLSIVKSIVEAHHGNVSCSSNGQMTVFTFQIPLGDAHILPSQKMAPRSSGDILPSIGPEVVTKAANAVSGKRDKCILVVEDNDELRDSLRELFSPVYDVLTARDGIDALSVIGTRIPDIIVSDLMMPNMDGNELCRILKNRVDTSDVPFLMLTAMTSEKDTINALREGADDYVCKPFNSRVLVAKCNALVASRVRMVQSRANVKANLDSLAINASDKEFMDKVSQVVLANISNPEFDVEAFASELFMSRSSFFSKMKALSGMPPNRFVTSVRLNYAKDIIDGDTSLSVNEVSYLCGFNTPSYFIKLFKKSFGVSPSEYKNTVIRKTDTTSA